MLTVFETLALGLLLPSELLLTLPSRLLQPLILEFLHGNREIISYCIAT